MTRALQVAHLLVLLAVLAFLGVLGWRAWTLADELGAVLAPVPATESKINLELDEAHRLTLEAGLTAMEARKASAEELKYLPKWDARISETFGEAGETFGHADETIAAIRETANAATGTFQGATVDLDTLDDAVIDMRPLLITGNDTLKNIDDLVASPAIPQIETHVESMTGDGARITKDAADETDKLAHPNKKKLTFWGSIWLGVQFVHKLEPPIF